MVHTPLTKRHIFWDKLELPTPAPIVEKCTHGPFIHAEHERVEVWGGPDAQDGEFGVFVGRLEGLDFFDEEVAVEGRRVDQMRYDAG